MGYTHYWYRADEFDREKFAAAVADCDRFCDALATSVSLCNREGVGKPEFTADHIAFNGWTDHDQDCEPFIVERKYCPQYAGEVRQDDGLWFDFCKTRELPYDAAVTGCLVILKHHLGDQIEISSDGGDAAFAEARQCCAKLIGLECAVPV